MKPEWYLGTYQERFVRGEESRAQRVMEYSFLSSIPPSPVLLHFLLCIIDRGNADSRSELQETLFPGEETSRAVLPAHSAASFCPMPFSPGLHPEGAEKGQGRLRLPR